MKTLGTIISRLFAITVLKIWGWNITGQFPKSVNRMVVVVAPHTHQLFGVGDVLLGWCVKEILGLPKVRFLVKYEEYYNWYRGWFIRWIGGIPIDRKKEFDPSLKNGDQLKNAISIIRGTGRDNLCFVVTPQGTRDINAEWKSGFIRIAKETDLPIFLVAFNLRTKNVIIDSELPKLPKPEYLQIIRNFYHEQAGYDPKIEDSRFPD